MASFTNVYWAPDKFTKTRSFAKPISGHLGIDFSMVKQEPVTAGFFFGQNQPLLTNQPPQATAFKPEYFVGGDGVLPTVGGKPRTNIAGMNFRRGYK